MIGGLTRIALGCVLLQPLAGQEKRSIDIDAVARTVLDASYPPSFEHTQLFERIDRTLADIASTPLAWTLTARWIALAHRAESSPIVWKRIAHQLDNDQLHGLARHSVRSALATRFRNRGKTAEADQMSPRGEYVRKVLAVGPFGDDGSIYHGLPYPPEREALSLASRWRGRFDTETWRLVDRRPTTTRIDLTPSRGAKFSKGCQYALVQIKSPQQQPAWLQVYCAGSFEAWWNGSRVSSVNRYAKRWPTMLFTPVALRAGWNRYLFKTTSANVSTFSLRIVDARGNALGNVQTEDGKRIHDIAPAQGKQPDVPSFQMPEDWTRDQVRAGRPTPAVSALLANLDARQTRTDTALAAARGALVAGGKDPTVRAACLETVRMARHVPGDLLRSELRRILEGTGDTDHRHLFLARVERLFADDKREDALRLVDARLNDHPKEIPTLNRKYDLLRRMRWQGDARHALERLVTLAPRHMPYVLTLAELEDREGNPKKALARLEAALADRPLRSDLLLRALVAARKLGDRDRVARLLESVHKNDPDSAAAHRARASQREQEGKFAEAAAALLPLAQRQPRDAALAKRVGDLWWLAGEREKALDEYRRSLALRPEQHTLRSWILRAAGGKEFAELQRFQLDAPAAVAAYTARSEDEAAPVTLVLDQMIIRVYEDGSQMEETHVLKRVNDRRGIDRSEQAEQAAAADELLELRTILPDGSWFAPHRVDGTFSMPRLAPGVFIEEHYRTYKSSPGATPIDFVRFYFRGMDRPFRYSRLVVIMPNSARYKEARFGDFVLRNFDEGDVAKHDLGDLTAWEFLKKDMPKIGGEVSMPALEELAPWVTFGRAPDMAAFVRAQKNGFQRFSYPYREVRKKTHELIKDVKGDVARARAIHDFCHTHVPRRPGSPYPVSVLLKREGDRFMLQLSMLRAAGIRWTPAVIHPAPPESDRDTDAFLQPGTYYGRRGARVFPKDGAPFWILQGTPRYFPFARTPAAIGSNPTAGCPYLLLEGETGIPGRLAGQEPTELADVRVRARMKLEKDRAIMKARVTFPDRQGFLLKEFVRGINDNRRQVMGRQIAAALFRGFTMRGVDAERLDDTDEPLTLVMRLERSRFVRRSGAVLQLPPVLQPSMLTRRFGGRGNRNHAFDCTSWSVSDWEIVIDPGALRFPELPRGLLLRKSIFDYGLSYQLDGKALRVRRVSILRPGRIPPGAYKGFLDYCRRIDNAESRRIRVAE